MERCLLILTILKRRWVRFRSLQQSLFGDLNSFEWEGSIVNSGNAAGEVTGGNLSLII